MVRVPAGMAHLLAGAGVGRVVDLQVRPLRREPTRHVEAWDLSSSEDHSRSTDRAVTLIQAEHLPVIEAILGRPVRFEDLRRNVLVTGINLAILYKRRFRAGDVILEGTKACDPCSRMEEVLGPGGYAAMLGHGGLCARVVTSGVLRIGDPVERLDDEA